MVKKRLYIEPGCITCGMCEFVAPQVFEVKEVSQVKQAADIQIYEAEIKKAVLECPVSVIVFEDEKKDF